MKWLCYVSGNGSRKRHVEGVRDNYHNSSRTMDSPKCTYTFAQRDTRLWLCPLSSKLVGSDDGCTYVEDQEGLMMVVAVLRSFSPKLMQAIMFAGGQSFYRMLEDLL